MYINPMNIVSVSGGKDSTACYLWAMQEFGADGFLAVFADTGHEHPVTLNYVRNLPQLAGGPPIQWVQADFTGRLHAKGIEPTGIPFLDMMLWKGRAPSTKAQFCTEHLKMQPIKDWLMSVRGDLSGDDITMFTGIRAGESARRAKMSEMEYMDYYDCWTERPLFFCTEAQIFKMLADHGIEPNPLYAAGFSRVGCFPCIHARKAELARLPDWAWDKLKEWEAKVGRTWFPPGLVPGIHITSIEDARLWSTTERGGRFQSTIPPDVADVPSCISTWGQCE